MKKTSIPSGSLCALLFLFSCGLGCPAWSQCIFEPVLHTSGTLQVGCTEVTVTSAGSVLTFTSPPCFFGPFFVGLTSSGNYTFTFSSPVSNVKIDGQLFDNHNLHSEEMAVDINGGFYPLTDPGLPAGCYTPLVLSPTGTLMAQFGGQGAGSDIIITENMNSITVSCNVISGTPSGIGFSLSICCAPCETEAGELTSALLNLCPDGLATFSPPTGTILDSDDLLEYILFTDPVDTLGSIVATSGISEFAFDPAVMQLGVTYYIAALAGNDLNGNVDHDDPCHDISNAIEVVWYLEPSVDFSATVTDVCADGCYDIEMSFAGTPPFHLQGEVVDANNTIVVFDEIYTDHSATMNICLPANTPIGNLTIQATGLSDEYCDCN